MLAFLYAPYLSPSTSCIYLNRNLINFSGLDERPGREPMPLSERSYPASEAGSHNGNEKVRMKSDLAETKSRPQSSR